jgi:CDP-glycerol glycerophosphotransferase
MRRRGAGLGSSRSRRDGALLSVVVPVYNVERYLAGCLESLLAQSFAEFEAILVDDGSTDGSSAVAERYAEADPRIRVVRQPNAGLGAARNRGVAEARGGFLTFLDSDDTLVPDAYQTMMSTLRRTGSDMAVGTLKRNHGTHHSLTPLMRRNHSARRERVTLADMPLAVADVFAVNKVFRRDFWDAAGLCFPEHIRYEDQPTLTQAFVAARRFDVLPELVYLWRVRDDGSSITQRRYELADLADRMESKRISTELVQRSGLAQLREVWFRDVLPIDMWEYFRSVPGCDDEYWKELQTSTSSLWSDHTVPFEQTRIPVQQRLMGWLVDHDRREDLERLIGFIDRHRGRFHLHVNDHIEIARLPGTEGAPPTPASPRSVFAFGEHERRWSA